jgi:hypothetical protein
MSGALDAAKRFCYPYLIGSLREMEMNYGKLIVVVALTAAAGSAQAFGLGLKAGTLGVGADLGFGILPTLGGRVGVSGMNVSTHVETSDVRYDAKAKFADVNLFLDWSPLGPFRITGGFIPNDNKIDLTGRASTASGNAVVPPGATLNGTVKPETSFAPYLGIGYGNVWTKGVNFYFDLGVMFQGTPEVSLSLNCGTASPAQCAAAQSQVAAERQRVQDKVDKYKYYPVANIGITIGF